MPCEGRRGARLSIRHVAGPNPSSVWNAARLGVGTQTPGRENLPVVGVGCGVVRRLDKQLSPAAARRLDDGGLDSFLLLRVGCVRYQGQFSPNHTSHNNNTISRDHSLYPYTNSIGPGGGGVRASQRRVPSTTCLSSTSASPVPRHRIKWTTTRPMAAAQPQRQEKQGRLPKPRLPRRGRRRKAPAGGRRRNRQRQRSPHT